MEAPEKIYLFENPITETPDDRWLSKRSDDNDIEYIRKDVVDDMLATAEDHAYFAGSERAKEKLTNAFIEKACAWLNKHAKKYYFNKEGHYLGTEELVEDFKLSMAM